MERIDDIGFGGLKLIQEPTEFCYGVDSVILSDFAAKLTRGKPNTCVDIGTGTGIIPMILTAKTEWQKFYAVEIQENSAERARRSFELNGLDNRVEVLNADVKELIKKRPGFLSDIDVVTSNPPYTAGSRGLVCDNSAKHIARTETTAGLEDFMKLASLMLKPKGDFFMVHRPSRMVDIFHFGRQTGLEPKNIMFVSPKPDTSPNILLVHMVKGGGSELNIMKNLIIHNPDNSYTEELMECYR